MTEKAKLEVAGNSLSLARSYIAKGNIGRAFSHYLVSLKLNPLWKSTLKEEFSTVLCEWGTVLEKENRFEDLFNCYEQALEVFPENEVILNNLGAHLLRIGSLKEAAHYFQKSLFVQPCYVRGVRNLENLKNLAVERWHFRMLNDNHRNECFREAIIKKIKQGFDTVLDVGTGTGILSLFGVEGGAKDIIACDSSSIMTDIAEKVFSHHKVTNIKLINKHSMDLKPNVDLRGRVSLLVTETLDSGLLGEGILSTLSDAWDRLLLPPAPNTFRNDGSHGFVIPFSATLYIAGIQCDEIYNSFYPQTSEFELTSVNCQNYDTMDLKRVDHKLLTNVYEVAKINFNHPVLIKELLAGTHDRDHKVKCEVSGRLDCFAVWFELSLDEDIKLNTGPTSTINEAWDQAIFLLPTTVLLQQNEDLPFHVSFKNGKLNVTSDIPRKIPSSSVDILKILNDDKLKKSLSGVLELLSEINKPVNILDCFSFPFVGVGVLTSRKSTFEDRMTCLVRSESDKTVLESVFNRRGISNYANIIDYDNLEELLETGQKFDVVLLDLLEVTGELNEKIVSQLETFRSLLKPEGILFPEEATVLGQFIHSCWLDKVSKVKNECNTCGYTIQPFINVYQTSHQIDLHLRTEEQNHSSEHFDLFSILPVDSRTEIIASAAVKGTPNALLYWFRIKFLKNSDEVWSNHDNSLYGKAAFLFPKFSKNSSVITCKIIRDGELFIVKLENNN